MRFSWLPPRMSDNPAAADWARRPMTATSPATLSPAAALDAIVSALRRGDMDKAQAAFDSGGGMIDSSALSKLADLNVRRRRWADADWFLSRLPESDVSPAVVFRRNLCRNLAALQIRYPAMARLLAELPPGQRVRLAVSGTGHPTIAVTDDAGQTRHLSPADRPLAAASETLRQVRSALDNGACIGLLGVGDGYALFRLSRENPPLLLGMQVPVCVIEPDPQVVLHAMMIHDYSGPEGPILQQRFNWHVGPNWETTLRQELAGDPFLPPPGVLLTLGPTGAEVALRLRAMSAEIGAADAQAKGRVERYYADHRPQTLADLLSPGAARKPRALLLTTRFSTVLQYSTRDAASALERLGWDVKLLIEATPIHRLMQMGIRRALDEFQPDLVLQIDHLRHEHGELFPMNLPFACWIQDYLPNLASVSAGRRVGPTDFALTGEALTCVHEYEYPARQCVGLTKLTNVPAAPMDAAPPTSRDVIFVSNASRSPADLLTDFVATLPTDGPARAIVSLAAERIVASYAGQEVVCTYAAVRRQVDAAAVDLGVRGTREVTGQMAAWLYHPFVDALYRQQALTWAADACAPLGLTLGLYGKGWDRHPTLGAFARGPIDNGLALLALSRSSLLNLQIVPYICLHPRLLDGLAAGGLFLIRQHPSDVAPGRLLDLLQANGDIDAASENAARLSMAHCPHLLPALESAIEAMRRCACSSGAEDPLAYLQAWRSAGMVEPGTGVLPSWPDVAFSSAAELAARMADLASNVDRRKSIHAALQASVMRRFTYESGFRRVTADIAARLARGAADRQAELGKAA